MPREKKNRILYIDTSLRNPERIKTFLSFLVEYNDKIFTEELAKEVERAINESYGDDKKIQIVRNVDDEINIDLSKLNADGSTSSLDAAITVDLLTDSYVTSQQVTAAPLAVRAHG